MPALLGQRVAAAEKMCLASDVNPGPRGTRAGEKAKLSGRFSVFSIKKKLLI
jgi:hypothetical protein